MFEVTCWIGSDRMLRTKVKTTLKEMPTVFIIILAISISLCQIHSRMVLLLQQPIRQLSKVILLLYLFETHPNSHLDTKNSEEFLLEIVVPCVVGFNR